MRDAMFVVAKRMVGGWCPPLAAATGATALALLVLWLHVGRTSIAQAARSVYLFVNFGLVLNYTVVILDSYDLFQKLGADEAASGRMVGNYMLGFTLGAISMWLLLRCTLDLWRDRPRQVLVFSLLFQLAGAFAYTWVANVVDTGTGCGVHATILICARFVSGMGSGACQQFYMPSVLHLTPVASRAEHTARWVPVLAALLRTFQVCRGDPLFALVGHAQLLLTVGSLLAVACLHPSLAGCEDCKDSDGSDLDDPAKDTERDAKYWQRVVLICGCFSLTGLRSFGVSGIEVVVAELLERKQQWDQRITGVTIGLIFLCCVPLKATHSQLQHSLSVTGWIRLLSMVATLGTLLLFTESYKIAHLAPAAVLVAAGVIVFPTFYLSDALSTGLMHQHVLGEGSLFDGNHAQLWYNLSQGLGRFLGPWLARLTLQVAGQDWFAAKQLAVTSLFLLLFELSVRPFIRSPKSPRESTLVMRQLSF
eukprot:CAMPEP_0168507002 /NCGR_PEP_ID=MMETSP0228-20121227/77659_1 /TAXON_ID=133427 /ORGANISM="Protoceratium reticulatum, Strain CCCM 535 (=CCMP 1889)" /LENGTH=478 /DNA_ID=CAMNT_0008524101 /DNA_START=71 /DNA_END=1507 /DNA_ORIENTATION=-